MLDRSDMSILDKLFDDLPDSESCPFPGSVMPRKLSLAMAYVPYQTWAEPYEADVALSRGTVFPCLDKPFIGEEAVTDADTE